MGKLYLLPISYLTARNWQGSSSESCKKTTQPQLPWTSLPLFWAMCREFCPSPWFCVTAVIIGGFCTNLAQCSFSDSSLALQLNSLLRLRLRSVYNSTWHDSTDFFCRLIYYYFISYRYWSRPLYKNMNRAVVALWLTFRPILLSTFTDLHSRCSQIVTLEALSNGEYWTTWFYRDFFNQFFKLSNRDFAWLSCSSVIWPVWRLAQRRDFNKHV